MRSAQEVGSILTSERRPERRILYLAGLLTEALGRDSVIVVGGSAIEILTSGGYVSGDVDLIVSSPDRAVQVLQGWGFSKGGRLWMQKEWELYVDLVGRDYTGSRDRTREVQTPFGTVRIAAVEDCLVKRLASAKHWRIPSDLDHAELLMREYRGSIDWAYLRGQARYYVVEDVLNELERLVGEKGEKEGAVGRTRRRPKSEHP